MPTTYTPKFLAALSDDELTVHLKDAISDLGEQDRDTQLLGAEFDRRGLSFPSAHTKQPEHMATSAGDFAMLLEAMEGQGDKWEAAIFADAAAQGITREEIEAAKLCRTVPLDCANDHA